MARGKHRAEIISWDKFDGDISFDYYILAEGDSWFTIAGFPATNLLKSLRFKRPTLIVSCAYPGDTIKKMSQIAKNRKYREALSEGDGYPWSAVILSGGGNDMIELAGDVIMSKEERGNAKMTEAKDYCNKEKLSDFIKEIKAGYESMVLLRDKRGGRAQNVPIVVHTYDYTTPRNSPAKFLTAPMLGPWLFKSLSNAEVPKEDWEEIADYLIDQLAEAILSLTNLPHFYIADTRKVLERAQMDSTGNNNDWLNEIHPNHDGYTKLAKKIEETLIPLLPGN